LKNELQNRLFYVSTTGHGFTEITIERSGKPRAVLIPMDVFEQLVAE
jgi:hypothetical protein